MKRVAEIIYIVEDERQSFLDGALNLTNEEEQVLWHCGVRKQQYFAINEFIFMTFEYSGKDENFANDMQTMASYLDSKGLLVKRRRKDVPIPERATTNWWAPIKRLGSVLDHTPASIDSSLDIETLGMLSNNDTAYSDISYDDDDWSESMHI